MELLQYDEYFLIDLQIEFSDNLPLLQKIVQVTEAVIPYLDLYHETLKDSIEVFNGYIFCPAHSLKGLLDQFNHNAKYVYHEEGYISRKEIEGMIGNFYRTYNRAIKPGVWVKVTVGEFKSLSGEVIDVGDNEATIEYKILDGMRQATLPITALELTTQRPVLDLGYTNYMENPKKKIAVVMDGERMIDRSLSGVYKGYYRKGDGMFVGIAYGTYYLLLKTKILYPEACLYYVFGEQFRLPGVDSYQNDIEYNLRWIFNLIQAAGFVSVYVDRGIDSIVLSTVRALEEEYQEVHVFTGNKGLEILESEKVHVNAFTMKGYGKIRTEVNLNTVFDVEPYMGETGFDEEGLKRLLTEMKMYQELEMFFRIKNQLQGVWP